MARNIDDIYSHVSFHLNHEDDPTIDAALDPDIAMFITSSTVTGVENSRVRLITGSKAHTRILNIRHTFM